MGTLSDEQCIELTVDRRAARKARKFVGEVLGRWGHQDIEDEVSLAVSELVTNAVIHAKSETKVTLINHGDAVQIRVHDMVETPPQRRTPSPEATGGRGIFLVEALSADWGVDVEPPGKTVWLDIRRT